MHLIVKTDIEYIVWPNFACKTHKKCFKKNQESRAANTSSYFCVLQVATIALY